AQGMLVSVPLSFATRDAPPTLSDLEQLFLAYYADASPNVVVHKDTPVRLAADTVAGDDAMHLYLFDNEPEQQCLLVAKLDNLGKGAAGAAVQNIKLMLGI
nr:N-acetyl-gamma-glutamyl-phosphate reductase [Alphaproteobacteria bacterium]